MSIQKGAKHSKNSWIQTLFSCFCYCAGTQQNLQTFSAQLIFNAMTDISQSGENGSCCSNMVVCLQLHTGPVCDGLWCSQRLKTLLQWNKRKKQKNKKHFLCRTGKCVWSWNDLLVNEWKSTTSSILIVLCGNLNDMKRVHRVFEVLQLTVLPLELIYFLLDIL